MTPVSPDKVLPAAVRDFRLSQEGDSLALSWLLPRENLLGQPLTQLQGFRLYRAEVKGVQTASVSPRDFVLCADIDLAYPQVGEVEGEKVLYQDRDLRPERRYYYKVAAYDPDGYLGAWSPALSHAWGLLPRAPQELKARAGDKVVLLTWNPVTQLQNGSPLTELAGYRVYRRSGDTAWIRLTPQPVSGIDYQDLAVLNEVEYNYKVRAVRRLGPDPLESLDSSTRMAQPEKLTPPPPLLNLVALASPRGVEVRWDPSPAPDLAGYRVYRRQAGEAKFILITRELLKKDYFLDTQVAKRQTYYYYVTAVDNSRRANESLPSEEAVVSF